MKKIMMMLAVGAFAVTLCAEMPPPPPPPGGFGPGAEFQRGWNFQRGPGYGWRGGFRNEGFRGGFRQGWRQEFRQGCNCGCPCCGGGFRGEEFRRGDDFRQDGDFRQGRQGRRFRRGRRGMMGAPQCEGRACRPATADGRAGAPRTPPPQCKGQGRPQPQQPQCKGQGRPQPPQNGKRRPECGKDRRMKGEAPKER